MPLPIVCDLSYLRDHISLVRDQRCVEHAVHAQELVDEAGLAGADAQFDCELHAMLDGAS